MKKKKTACLLLSIFFVGIIEDCLIFTKFLSVKMSVKSNFSQAQNRYMPLFSWRPK